MSYFAVPNWQQLALSRVAPWVTLDGVIIILPAGVIVPDSLARGLAEVNHPALASLWDTLGSMFDLGLGRLQVDTFHLQCTQIGGAHSFVQYSEEDSGIPADRAS